VLRAAALDRVLVTKAADVTMAPASSAQREPSMEEILASIRRIIEDNDSGRKQPGDTDIVRGDNDSVSDRTVIEVDAFRNELRSPSVEARPTPPVETRAPVVEPRSPPVEVMETAPVRRDPPEKKPVTLAEVQAQVTAETRVAPAASWPPEKSAVSQRLAAEDRINAAIEAARAQRNESTRVATDAASVIARPSEERKPEAVPVAKEAAPVAKPIEVEKPVAASVPAINHSDVMESAAARPAILSERAERKIAASFGELSEAFAARSRKTFDDMAEEMMRPMLQDWLDNNLPVLVERLVREEIERVARG